MRPRLVHRVGFGVVVTVPALLLAALLTSSGDYGAGMSTGDSPAPTIAAVLHGHLGLAVARQPLIGLSSILLRLPFAGFAAAIGGGTMLQYRFGVFACAVVVGALGAFVVEAARVHGRWAAAAAVLAGLMIVSPLTLGVRLGGHPEELLGGALCVGSVLAATEGRPRLAGALLGAALGTKQWALIAVVPAVLACRERRMTMLLTAGVVAAPLALALPIADPHAFLSASKLIGDLHETYIESWWWPFSVVRTATVHVGETTSVMSDHLLPLSLSREQVSWLPMVASLPLGWLYRRHQPGRDPIDAVGLLALLLLLRCTLDPSFVFYYVTPLVIALFAWELLRGPRLPLASLLSIAVFSLIPRFTNFAPAVAISLAFTIGLTAYLCACVLRDQHHGRAAVVAGRVAVLR
jgi:hypothetical protein